MGKLVNRAKMTVASAPGTGAIPLGSAVAGYQTLAAAGVVNGDLVSYAIEDGSNWELGLGSYASSGPTLTRSTVLASSNSGSAISASSAALVFVTPLAGDIAPPPWGITGGLPTAMSGTSTTAAITVSPLTATDASGVMLIEWTAAQSWAVSNGNAANGCADGTTLGNSKTYHMYACQGPSGTCLYASQTFGMAASSAPSGYNSYARRIFSFTTSSAGAPNAGNFDEIGGGGYQCLLSTIPLDINAASSTSSSRTLYALSVPTGPKMQWLGRFNAQGGANGATYILSSPDEPDVAPVTPASPGSPFFDLAAQSTVSAAGLMHAERSLLTNTSAQLGVRSSSSANGTLYLVTTGWIDFRRS
ncbi:MAG: hypothetical protein ABSA66_15855 [Roseiarcus sp.]|jgi:hypothetical protein